METTLKTDGKGRSTVELKGRLVAACADEVLRKLEALPDADVCFDMTGTEHVDSRGLGVLVQALMKARRRGRRVALAGLRPDVRLVFEVTRVDRVFEILGSPLDF